VTAVVLEKDPIILLAITVCRDAESSTLNIPAARGKRKTIPLSSGLGFAFFANHDALVAWPAGRPMEI
jgi:hypothetical protein